ncbi:MAG: sulfotransferase family protein [Acidobacteriota bacterium]|nr:sulfotransferase family protein [Acidobacteriota bacterium]
MSAENGARSNTEAGRPIIVVSGLPRSGTSMAMAMLTEGGLQCLDDGVRKADEHNPNGYFEDERVKTLESADDAGWIGEARGRVVKVVSPLLKNLPSGESYRVLFMLRDLDEVLASQKKMMDRRGEQHDVPDDQMKRIYRDHLTTVNTLLKSRPDTTVKYLEFRSVIDRTREITDQINAFLDLDLNLDLDRMAAVVDKKLYRNRSA